MRQYRSNLGANQVTISREDMVGAIATLSKLCMDKSPEHNSVMCDLDYNGGSVHVEILAKNEKDMIAPVTQTGTAKAGTAGASSTGGSSDSDGTGSTSTNSNSGNGAAAGGTTAKSDGSTNGSPSPTPSGASPNASPSSPSPSPATRVRRTHVQLY